MKPMAFNCNVRGITANALVAQKFLSNEFITLDRRVGAGRYVMGFSNEGWESWKKSSRHDSQARARRLPLF